MSRKGVRFIRSESESVDSSDYHKGELAGGCRIESPISECDADVRAVFDVNKPSRSMEYNVLELEAGCLVDLSYKKSSNSVNTPYRVVQICTGDGEYNDTFDAEEYDFKVLFEPVIQNASLVLVCGFEREYEDGNNMVVLEDVYYKTGWDDPRIDGLQDMEYPSEFFKVGFEEKDRRMTSISIVFDEVIAECVDLEDKLVPIVI